MLDKPPGCLISSGRLVFLIVFEPNVTLYSILYLGNVVNVSGSNERPKHGFLFRQQTTISVKMGVKRLRERLLGATQ